MVSESLLLFNGTVICHITTDLYTTTLAKKKKRKEVKNKQQKERSSREVTFLQEFYVLGITQLLMNDIV